jgi:DNA polymerase III subunit delta
MTALTLEAVYRALKRGEPSPVYYLTGEADVLKDELVTTIVRTAVDESSRDFNVDVRSAGDLDGEALHSLVETPPMLAARRAVVVRNLEQWRANASVWKVLLRYLEAPSPTTVLILLHGPGEKINPDVAARAEHVEVDTLAPAQLLRWLKSRAEKAGILLEPDAAEHLITAVGSDIGCLSMEIDKLAAAAPAGAPVTVDLVSQLVGIRRGETLPDWVHTVLQRQQAKAVSLLEIVLPQAGISGVKMVTALGTALIGTRLARAMADTGMAPQKIAGELFQLMRRRVFQVNGSWDKESKSWAAAAGRWTAPELDQALAEVLETDRALKNSTLSDEREALAGLMLTLGKAPERQPGAAA